MTLRDFFMWILSGGGAGVIAYALMEQLGRHTNISAEMKRYLSLLLAALVAVLAYSSRVWIGYEPRPETVKAWIEALFAVIAIAIPTSQAIHGFVALRVRG